MKADYYLIRKLFTLLLLITAWTLLYAAEPADSTKYDSESLSVHVNLLQMEKKGVTNADLYNQIGLSYYKQGKTGKAVLYFLRALRLDSNNSDARNNIDYAINQTLDREFYSKPSFVYGMIQKIYNFFTLNALAAIVLILLIITTLCLHWIFHLPTSEDKAIPMMWLIIFGFLLLVAATTLGIKYRGYHNNSEAVIIEPLAEGFSGPGQEYGKLFTVHEGLIIHINRIDKEWALSTLPNGGAGWVPVFAIEGVKP